MWRAFVGLAALVCSVGAVAGGIVIGFLIRERDFRGAGGVMTGTALLAWGAFAFWQDWRRAQQERGLRAGRSDGSDPTLFS
jgi:hypothetical protein